LQLPRGRWLHQHAGAELRVTVSIGIGEYIKGEELDALIERVERALYEAKGAGRNLVRASRSSSALTVSAAS